MFTFPQPDGCLSATDVKELAEDLVEQFPLPGIEGSTLDPGKIWPAVTLAAVNQTSIWETCKDNDKAPCDDTVMDWLHTLNREWLERRDRSRLCGVRSADLTPKQVERLYQKRSAIETSYRVFHQARVVTTTQDPIVRFAFVLIGFLLENLWLVLRWAVVARPRRGGRDLPEEFTFKTLSDWIRHALEEELERSWEIEMNGVGVPEAYTPAAGWLMRPRVSVC